MKSLVKDPKQMTMRLSRPRRQPGTTSTVFIGPACRPKAVKSKPDMEETLKDFYKELEEVERTDNSNCTTDEALHKLMKSHNALNPSVQKESLPNSQKRGTGPNQACGPQGCEHEPHHPKRPRPTFDQHMNSDGPYSFDHQHEWQHPAPPHRHGPSLPPPPHFAPYPRFHRRPLPPPLLRPPYHRFHRPPFNPPHPFPGSFGPADRAAQMNWGYPERADQYHPDLQFRPPYRQPVPNGYSHSHDFDPPYHYESYENDGWSEAYEGQDSEMDQGYDEGGNPHQRQEDQQQPQDTTCEYDPSLVLILMRGVPGSGKSTLAKELLSTGPNGLILSTDDYFSKDGSYLYDPGLLEEAHQWNLNRAEEAMQKGLAPVIIDNTNIQAWEMKPYIKLALERGYSVSFREPHTSWKHDPTELERRTKHGVSREKIAQMLDRFESPISIAIVMNSKKPPHKICPQKR